MKTIVIVCQRVFYACVALALTVLAETSQAQISDVTVGITPTCPYGLEACWAGAYEALMRIDGVKSVSTSPDLYNCTASVRLKHKAVPDPNAWNLRFKSIVDQVYLFRGVEITVQGTITPGNDSLVLQVPDVEQSITLEPLQHKLQWNSKEGAVREPEPVERDAYQHLATQLNAAQTGKLNVQVTGPFRAADKNLVLEVREFFSAPTAASSGKED